MGIKTIGLATLLSTLTMANLSHAQVPNTFADGEPAVASEVNDNFSNLDGRATTNATAIGTIESNATALTGRVTALEGVTANSTVVDVDCSTDSITDAINNAPAAGQLTVNIAGSCTETVVITRSNTSLVGAAGASISFDSTVTSNPIISTINNTISIIGAQNVVVDGLAINGATASGFGSGSGVSVSNGSAALIKDSTITGNYRGVRVKGATARLSGNNINSNALAGLITTDSGFTQLIGGNTITQTGAQAGVTPNFAVGAFRNATITATGTNNISATADGDNRVISLAYGAQFRSFFGLLTANGESRVSDTSQINFRDVAYTGDIAVAANGTLRLTNRSDQTFSGVNVTGNITVDAFGVFNAANNTSVTGNVTCNSSLALAGGSAVVSGTFTPCT